MVHTVPSGTGPGKSYTAHPVETGITAVTTLVKGNTEIDIIAIADEVGLKGTYNRYERRDVRYIIAKLMVRASEPEVVQRLAAVYQSFTARQD